MKQNKGERIIYDEGNSVNLTLTKFKRFYGTTITIKQAQKADQHISYQIKMVSKPTKHPLHLLEIHRMDLRVNHQKPHQIMDVLAYRCGAVLYPLRLYVDNRLQIRNIANYKRIIYRWLQTKEQLRGRFEDDKRVLKYLNVTEATLLNRENILRVLKRDFFLTSYFTDLYGRYRYRMAYNEKILTKRVPVLPNTKPVRYEVEQRAHKRYTTFDMLTISQQGRLNDERSSNDIAVRSDFKQNATIADGDTAQGILSATYQLDKQEKTISSVIASYSIVLPYGESREIDFKTFHLQDKDSEFKN